MNPARYGRWLKIDAGWFTQAAPEPSSAALRVGLGSSARQGSRGTGGAGVPSPARGDARLQEQAALAPLPQLSLTSMEPLDGAWRPCNNSDISANHHVFLVCLQNAAQARFFVMLNLVGKLRRKTNTAQTVAKGAINTALGQWYH